MTDRIPKYRIEAGKLRPNNPQWDAYNSRGHTVVLAGPGSGKTKTLVTKVARMLHEDVREPRGVACVTFSNECARELERRLADLGVVGRENLFIGTVHTFCLQHIVLPYARLAGLDIPEPIAVAKSIERKDALGEALFNLGIHENPENRLNDFNKSRRYYLGPSRENLALSEDETQLIVEYEQALRRHGLIDFDDMVVLGLRLIDECTWVRDLLCSRFPIIVVDEYQDLGIALHLMVQRLCFDSGIRLFAVGDRDQSIYSFMGAQPDLLEQLASRKEVECFHLNLNYRCGRYIVRASEIVLAEQRNYSTPDGAEEGDINVHAAGQDRVDHAKIICEEIIPSLLQLRKSINLNSIAVIYNTKYDGDAIAGAVETAGMQYTRIDNNATYPKTRLTRWIEQCAQWCSGGWRHAQPRLDLLTRTWEHWNSYTYNPSERKKISREFSTFLWNHIEPQQLLGDWLGSLSKSCLIPMFDRQPDLADEQEPLDKLIAACKPGRRFAEFTINKFAGQSGAPDHLNLITLHSAKGREFDIVIMMKVDHGTLPRNRISPAAKKEARRLFYVGLTRAKAEVHITYSRWGYDQYGRRVGPSEFLIELAKKFNEQAEQAPQ